MQERSDPKGNKRQQAKRIRAIGKYRAMRREEQLIARLDEAGPNLEAHDRALKIATYGLGIPMIACIPFMVYGMYLNAVEPYWQTWQIIGAISWALFFLFGLSIGPVGMILGFWFAGYPHPIRTAWKDLVEPAGDDHYPGG